MGAVLFSLFKGRGERFENYGCKSQKYTKWKLKKKPSVELKTCDSRREDVCYTH